MDYNQIRNEIENRLHLLDFASLYEGFHPFPFAIYNKEFVWLKEKTIPRDERFFGNTAIVFDQDYLAIWNIEESALMDLDVLTSKIVHEMFHAFQKEQQEMRFPNEQKGISLELNAENITYKFNENMRLIEAVTNANSVSFDEFLQIRKYRQVQFPDYLDYEIRTEENEGLAQYIEWQVLKQLNDKLFQQEIQKATLRLMNKHTYLSLRKSCYDSGALLFCYLDDVGFVWKYPIARNYTLTMELILPTIMVQHVSMPMDLEMVKIVDEEITKRSNQISNVIHQSVTIEGPFELMGFDPLNAYQMEHFVYNPMFFAYFSDGHPKVIQGKSVVEITNDWNILRIYCYAP